MRIEVGYGLEGAVPDITAGRIIDGVITPAFKEGDYDRGVMDGVAALMRASQGEEFAAAPTEQIDWFYLGFLALIIGQFVLSLLASILARSKSWWLGGVVGAAGGAFVGSLFGDTLTLLLGAGALGAAGLLFDYLVSKSYRNYKENGTAPPWYFGGTGGFGGGSSGGGFGGGSFGGGGSSGSW